MRNRGSVFLYTAVIALLMMVLMNEVTVVDGFLSPPRTHHYNVVVASPVVKKSSFSHRLPASAIDTTFDVTINTYSQSAWKQVARDTGRRIISGLPTAAMAVQTIINILGKFWWSLPLFSLAGFPLFSAITTGTYACMPEWWPVVCLKGIFGSSFWIVVSGFLASNVCYFLSGAYLLNRFKAVTSGQNSSIGSSNNNKRFLRLGLWILLSGLISTMYHSVQALVGVNAFAETLAYVDHGVALSAACYYLDVCGLPSKKVLGIGLTGLVCLAVCYNAEMYAILYSIWHGLSAAAATTWAVEGHGRKMIQETVTMEFFGQTDKFLIKRI